MDKEGNQQRSFQRCALSGKEDGTQGWGRWGVWAHPPDLCHGCQQLSSAPGKITSWSRLRAVHKVHTYILRGKRCKTILSSNTLL